VLSSGCDWQPGKTVNISSNNTVIVISFFISHLLQGILGRLFTAGDEISCSENQLLPRGTWERWQPVGYVAELGGQRLPISYMVRMGGRRLGRGVSQ